MIFSDRHLVPHVDCVRVKLKFELINVTDPKEINCWNQTTLEKNLYASKEPEKETGLIIYLFCHIP